MRRTRRHVGALLDRAHQRRDVAAVHLEVHVEVAGDLAARRAEAVGHGGAAAPVPLVEDHAESQLAGARRRSRAGSRACGRGSRRPRRGSRRASAPARGASRGSRRSSPRGARPRCSRRARGSGAGRRATLRPPPAARPSITRVDVVVRRAAGGAAGAAASRPRGRSPGSSPAAAERAAVGRRVQRHVVERRHRRRARAAPRSARSRGPRVGVEQVEDVVVRLALGQLGPAAARRARSPSPRAPRGSASTIAPRRRLDLGELVELRVEDRGEHVGEHVARALRDPGVLVHLAAQEGARGSCPSRGRSRPAARARGRETRARRPRRRSGSWSRGS